jgi:hypothetical protein
VEKIESESRFDRAIAALDAVNAGDPNSLTFAGETGPKELIHARRATYWIGELDPAAGELLLLAARAHHLRRWHCPRSEFPEGRAGYHAWRRELQNRHATEAAKILEACGYSEAETTRVGELIRKRGLGRDAEVQLLEDALCLVFIETQLTSFSAQHPDEKVIDIIARSLAKMSEEGRQMASRIALSEHESSLVSAAIERFANSAS